MSTVQRVSTVRPHFSATEDGKMIIERLSHELPPGREPLSDCRPPGPFTAIRDSSTPALPSPTVIDIQTRALIDIQSRALIDIQSRALIDIQSRALIEIQIKSVDHIDQDPAATITGKHLGGGQQQACGTVVLNAGHVPHADGTDSTVLHCSPIAGV